jgi:exosome complex exonuclease RRP6
LITFVSRFWFLLTVLPDFPSHGLAHLLQMFCDFTPDKRYQLADWRIRPLPEEMLNYARSDTHYLLYIYDRLRDALLSNPTTTPAVDAATPVAESSIREVLRRSEITALRTYEREVYDAETGSGPNGWATLAKKWNGFGFSKQGDGPMTPKMAVFRAVHKWRDGTARTEDESIRYVNSARLLNYDIC